jgi:hypothetical protein
MRDNDWEARMAAKARNRRADAQRAEDARLAALEPDPEPDPQPLCDYVNEDGWVCGLLVHDGDHKYVFPYAAV